jgi:putative transposase
VEIQQILDVLHDEEYIEETPYEIVPKLLDKGIYLASIRTFYRILASVNELRERRNQRRHPKYVKPVLKATALNQVWSWDITKLPGPFKGVNFYLYVMIDIFRLSEIKRSIWMRFCIRAAVGTFLRCG